MRPAPEKQQMLLLPYLAPGRRFLRLMNETAPLRRMWKDGNDAGNIH